METAQKFSLKSLLTLENLPYGILTIVFILVPLLVVPIPAIGFILSKSILVYAGVLIALLSTLIYVIKKGTLTFPKSILLLAAGAVSFVYLLSGLFSGAVSYSLFGQSFEISTFVSILFMSILMYLVSISFKEKSRLGVTYLGFFVVAGVLALYHVARFVFGADFLSFGMFPNIISNMIGKWNEVGIFFGVVALTSLLGLEIQKIGKFARYALYVFLIVSLGMLVAINFVTLWCILGAVALLLFVYQTTSSPLAKVPVVSLDTSSDASSSSYPAQTVTTPASSVSADVRQRAPKRKISFKTLGVLVIAIFFVTPIGQDIGRTISTKLGVDNLEVRPSWSATFEIFRDTIVENPVFGSGPNRFFTAWQLNRPDVNQTAFWNANFTNGIGFIPTAFVETGILGLLAWVGFLLAFLYSGYRTLSVRTSSELTRYFVYASFFSALFLWIACFVYTPGLVIVMLTFFFTGLFIASAVVSGGIKLEVIPFNKSQAASVVYTTASVAFFVLGLGLGYVMSTRAMSVAYFQKAVVAMQAGEGVQAVSSHLARSLSIFTHDTGYRALADVNFSHADSLIGNALNKTDVTEAEKAEFQAVLERMVTSARLAVQEDAQNFENHLMLAKVYSMMTVLQIEGAYEAAKAAYNEVIKLSPRNPAIYLALARLEGGKGDLAAAEAALNKALELKPNYVEAIFLQSQIDVSKGDLKKALASAEQAATIAQTDPLGFFRLGILKYELKDYRGAVIALERSISLAPVYANAKYYLGLSYAKTSRTADAIKQFEDLKASNPENQEVGRILKNLQAGRDAFTDASTTIANVSEKHDRLPIEE